MIVIVTEKSGADTEQAMRRANALMDLICRAITEEMNLEGNIEETVNSIELELEMP